MATFELALPFVLKHEGGWSDNPNDPGSATMKGITLAEARRWGINTKEELKSISDELVARIYKTDYWCFDGFTKQRVATKAFDASVNMGGRTAIRLLQRTLNSLGCTPYLVTDGQLGPKTLEAVNGYAEIDVLEEFCSQMEEYYRDIVSLHPERGVFLKGWVIRARDLPN